MKKWLLLFAAWLAMLQPVSAQEVTVTGMGQDKDSAIRDASRLAVEQVVGTLIDSRTLMENLVIQLDEVYKKSQGFVKKITVLQEERVDAETYRVQARIDVDTNPNAELMDTLTMLMRLNDPRIAVIVLNDWTDNQGSAHNADVESVLNNRLLELGFNHVIDADHVIKLHNAEFLNNIYEGRTGLSGMNSDNVCEFLVLGKGSANQGNVMVPDYRTREMMSSPIINASTKLNVKVLKYDTGEIIGTFVTKGNGLGNNDARAIDTAMEQAAKEAAGQLERTFKNFSGKSAQGLEVTIMANDYSDVENLVQTLRSLRDVNNVYIRSHDGGKAVLELDTMQKPHSIVAALRARSKQNIVVENMTNGRVTLRIN